MDSLTSQYDVVDRTRMKKLIGTVEKITGEDLDKKNGIEQENLLPTDTIDLK